MGAAETGGRGVRSTDDRPVARGLRLVPAPRAAPEEPPPLRVRAEVRAASIVSGDVAGIAVGEEHRLGLALDDHARAAEPAASWRPDAFVEHPEGVDLRGTLVAAAVGPDRRPVVEVRGVPVLLLGRGPLPAVGSRVLASGFLTLERRLWAACGGDGTRRWTVSRIRRQHLDVAAGALRSVDLLRLPTPTEVRVSQCYVLDLVRTG